MTKIPASELEHLLNLSSFYGGKTIIVVESISRNRDAGHDRHFATYSSFSFDVDWVTGSMSGFNLQFVGNESSYAVALEYVTSFDFDEKEFVLKITEHFEERTERVTTISSSKRKSS